MPVALSLPPRAGLSFRAAFPLTHKVSTGVMRYLAERDRELGSQGESTPTARPRLTLALPKQFSRRLLYFICRRSE